MMYQVQTCFLVDINLQLDKNCLQLCLLALKLMSLWLFISHPWTLHHVCFF